MLAFAVLSPFIGFISSLLFKDYLGKKGVQGLTTAMIGVSLGICFTWIHDIMILNHIQLFTLFPWISFDSYSVNWGLHIDKMSLIMMIVVLGVSFLVHIYSVGYMARDPAASRFMAYLSLFTFMMLLLVASGNILQLFVGWEGVGLASYLLIGFWNHKEKANAAALKAFLINRVADMAFLSAICMVFTYTSSFEIAYFVHHLPKDQTLLGGAVSEWIALFFLIGAMGKSAQFLFHTWLPDAMEGPTPVSALIHSATMVSAGVFLILRLSPLFEDAFYVRQLMIIIGGCTTFFAASVAMTQHDIKRVIAYSTCSQLGYMFLAAGLSAYTAAFFHLVTHACFKALLFLGAGSVIHAMSNEQDMRNMGGLKKKIPLTYAFMCIGSLALTGIPVFSGYFSKHLILEAAWNDMSVLGRGAFGVAVLGTFMTAFYTFRMIALTFFGQTRSSETIIAHIHEPPASMQLPMGVLVIGSVFSGMYFEHLGWFHSDLFWGSLMATPETQWPMPKIIDYGSLILIVSGIILGILVNTRYVLWKDRLVTKLSGIYTFVHGKWYFDELYHCIAIRPFEKLCNILWVVGDVKTLDQWGPNKAPKIVSTLSYCVSRCQTGYIYHYIFAMVFGIVALWALFIWI